jgi:ketosteroid isomerase-like protein
MMEPHDPDIDEALAAFIDALTHLDRDRLERCFAPDATVFHPMGVPRQVGFWNERWSEFVASQPGPPYFTLEPRDLQVQRLDNAAVVTFHLRGDRPLGRRTLVLRNGADGWKILHLHASNQPL